MVKKQSEKHLSSKKTTAPPSSLSKHNLAQVSTEHFNDSSLIFGLYIKDTELLEILSVSAKHAHSSNVLNISCKKGLEALSVTIKSSRVNILLTDMLDNMWKMTELFGPPASLAVPLKIGDYKLWKVSFRNAYDSSMVR